MNYDNALRELNSQIDQFCWLRTEIIRPANRRDTVLREYAERLSKAATEFVRASNDKIAQERK